MLACRTGANFFEKIASFCVGGGGGGMGKKGRVRGGLISFWQKREDPGTRRNENGFEILLYRVFIDRWTVFAFVHVGFFMAAVTAAVKY